MIGRRRTNSRGISSIPAIVSRPDECTIRVFQDHYVILTVNDGPEYQVWADSIRYGFNDGERTCFLQTLGYQWTPRAGETGWTPSGSFRVLLEVRAENILSIESVDRREVEVTCK